MSSGSSSLRIQSWIYLNTPEKATLPDTSKYSHLTLCGHWRHWQRERALGSSHKSLTGSQSGRIAQNGCFRADLASHKAEIICVDMTNRHVPNSHGSTYTASRFYALDSKLGSPIMTHQHCFLRIGSSRSQELPSCPLRPLSTLTTSIRR